MQENRTQYFLNMLTIINNAQRLPASKSFDLTVVLSSKIRLFVISRKLKVVPGLIVRWNCSALEYAFVKTTRKFYILVRRRLNLNHTSAAAVLYDVVTRVVRRELSAR